MKRKSIGVASLKPQALIRWGMGVVMAWSPWLGGCGVDGLLNQTAPLGGAAAGERGRVRVLFINNTPHRAILTAGTYDPADQNSVPDLLQFGAESPGSLEGASESAILDLTCGRVFSVGSARLVERIRRNADLDSVNEIAMIEGVGFSSTALDDPEAGTPDQGLAPGSEFLIGADFPCGALLIVRLEFNDPGPDPFRVNFSYIPSE